MATLFWFALDLVVLCTLANMAGAATKALVEWFRK
jgi:hypothetical protein